jgi:hypothetical protein
MERELWASLRLVGQCRPFASSRYRRVRRSGAAKLGWIIVGGRVVVVGPPTPRNGGVAIDPLTTWSDEAWGTYGRTYFAGISRASWLAAVPALTKPLSSPDTANGDNIPCERPLLFTLQRRRRYRLYIRWAEAVALRGPVQITAGADDHFKVSVVSARASLMARDEIPPKARRSRHCGIELPWLALV